MKKLLHLSLAAATLFAGTGVFGVNNIQANGLQLESQEVKVSLDSIDSRRNTTIGVNNTRIYRTIFDQANNTNALGHIHAGTRVTVLQSWGGSAEIFIQRNNTTGANGWEGWTVWVEAWTLN